MIFINYIKFPQGKLKRGERCLFRGFPATYMGSYVENGYTEYMIRVDAVIVNDLPLMEEYIVQTRDKKQITYIHQQEKPVEGQMQLC